MPGERLAGRRALVTGAGRGIGRAIALHVAREGARVVCASLEAAEVEETVAAVQAAGGRALALQVDIAVREEVERAVAAAAEWLGGIDAFVQAAGVSPTTPFLEIPPDEWHAVMATNLHGTFYASQAVARHMVGGGIRGALVLVTSQLTQVAIPNKAHYLASKGGLAMLTKGMALELAPHGIRVNALGPGVTNTAMLRDRLARNPGPQDWPFVRIPMGRLAEPGELGGAAAFLLSDEASYVTGTTLFVDGGYLAG